MKAERKRKEHLRRRDNLFTEASQESCEGQPVLVYKFTGALNENLRTNSSLFTISVAENPLETLIWLRDIYIHLCFVQTYEVSREWNEL